jgi:RND family efflux transporter MFP subunit
MARTQAGDVLTRQHRQAQVRLGALTAARIVELFRLLDPRELTDTSGAWIDASIRLIASQHAVSTQMPFEARIERISPTIDPRNGTFRATAYMNNADGDLAPGMFGRFSIAYEKHSDALLVPKTAVVFEDSENVVYVVRNGEAERRPVSLGIESMGNVEILGGLTSDEQVIVSGQTGLRDGSKVLAYAPETSLAAG